MHYTRGAGRSVRSPGTSGTTARPSGPISTGGWPASAGGRYRTRSGCSSTTAGRGWRRTRICGRCRRVAALGYRAPYPSFTRGLRSRGLRPHCEPCHPAAKRPVAVIEHPPAQEVPWDWLEVNKLTSDGRLAVRIVGGQDPATGLEPRTAN
jgi:hypothetical protein